MNLAKKFCTSSTAETFFKNYLNEAKNIDKALKNLQVVSMGNGNCVAELKIDEQHTNILKSLHGGFTANLIETVSSFGLRSLEVAKDFSSVDMNIRYLKSAQEGQTVLIESKLVKSGKRLSFLEVIIKDKETKDVIAKAEHTTCFEN